eukprot:237454_1
MTMTANSNNNYQQFYNRTFGGTSGMGFNANPNITFGTNSIPNLNANPITNSDGSTCWSWKDDTGWKAYDNATISQIESSYSNNETTIKLNQGPYFGASNRANIYMIQFNRVSMPPSYAQINTQTGFQREVMRTAGNKNNDNNNTDSNDNSDNKQKDKHFKWRHYYRPMVSTHYKKLKENEKRCLICFVDLEEKELSENQCKEFN